MTGTEPLLVEMRGDGVAVVAFNRPEQRNALDRAQWERLAAALKELAADADLRCLIITGAGDSFAAGGDLKTLLDELRTEADARAFRERLHACFSAICRFPRPTIARVNGPAIGGGLEIAVSCDIRIATPAAKFGMPAARFGIVMAQADFARLASIVGLDRARFLAITGEVIGAEEALRIGLVHEMKPADQLDETVGRWARRIVGMEPEAVASFRRMALAMEHAATPATDRRFEIDCLLRPEFRRRVEDFLRK